MKPTFLYIKTHKTTGLKYFGKTTRNPFKYKGSGKYWLRHLDKHGNEVVTEIYGLYLTVETCEQAALEFSRINNIVESDEWANLKEENGKDGGFEYVNANGLSGTNKARIINLGRKRPEHSQFMKNLQASRIVDLYATPYNPAGERWLRICEYYSQDMIVVWMKYPARIISKQSITLLKKKLGDKVSYDWVGKTPVECGFYKLETH